MVTFTPTAPVNVGTLTAPVATAWLKLTALNFSTKPALASIGTGELTVTLADPASGWQVTITYADASVPTFFAQVAPAPPANSTVEDV